MNVYAADLKVAGHANRHRVTASRAFNREATDALFCRSDLGLNITGLAHHAGHACKILESTKHIKLQRTGDKLRREIR
jgi:hypothetical protein